MEGDKDTHYFECSTKRLLGIVETACAGLSSEKIWRGLSEAQLRLPSKKGQRNASFWDEKG